MKDYLREASAHGEESELQILTRKPLVAENEELFITQERGVRNCARLNDCRVWKPYIGGEQESVNWLLLC